MNWWTKTQMTRKVEAFGQLGTKGGCDRKKKKEKQKEWIGNGAYKDFNLCFFVFGFL